MKRNTIILIGSITSAFIFSFGLHFLHLTIGWVFVIWLISIFIIARKFEDDWDKDL